MSVDEESRTEVRRLCAYPLSMEGYRFLNDLGRATDPLNGDHPILSCIEHSRDVPEGENVIYVGRKSQLQEEGYIVLEDAVKFNVRRLRSRRRIRDVLLCNKSSGEQTIIGAYKRIRDKKPGRLKTLTIPFDYSTDITCPLED